MNAIHNEGLFRTSDGLILFEQSHRHPREARAAVVIVHGYGEHSGRHTPLARKLTAEGYSVYAFDHRGHGKSEGLRAFVPHFSRLVDDLAEYLAEVATRERRIYLLGQSMGGTIAARLAAEAREELAGAILCSAAILPPKPYSLPVRLASRLASAAAPGMPIPAMIYSLETAALSRRPEIVSEYEKDPFVYHGPMLNRTGWELYAAMAELRKCMDRIRAPLLVMHGEADRITHPEGSRLLHDAAASTDKTLACFPEAYHELFKDLCDDEAWSLLRDWLAERNPEVG